jgi:hypothetical protein
VLVRNEILNVKLNFSLIWKEIYFWLHLFQLCCWENININPSEFGWNPIKLWAESNENKEMTPKYSSILSHKLSCISQERLVNTRKGLARENSSSYGKAAGIFFVLPFQQMFSASNQFLILLGYEMCVSEVFMTFTRLTLPLLCCVYCHSDSARDSISESVCL